MLRQLLMSNLQGYGEGIYGDGTYGGFEEITIADNWNFTKGINTQSTFQFTVIDNPNNLTIEKGIEVKFLIDGVVKFAGIITKISPYEDTPGYLFYDIECSTFEKLVNKRFVAQSFVNKSLKYITEWIVDNILYEEGIQKGNIIEGPTYEKVVFNYIKCDAALEKLQIASPGYNWYIDDDKYLHFNARATNKSLYTLDDDFIHVGFKPVDTLNEYRNIQYIDGGLRETNEFLLYKPTPEPDGVSRDFIVKFPIAQEPTIYINSVAVPTADVGVNGFDSGKKWYWSYNSDKLHHDENETVLTNTDVIEVDFYGLLDVKLIYDDAVLISERAAIDGNSGKYEESYTNKNITSISSAVSYAKGLIDKYKDQGYINLTIEDDIKDLDVNMLIKVEKSLFNIDDWYLIESIKAQQQTAEHTTYQLKLLSGEFVGNWEDYFKSLLQQESEISENDSIIRFKLFSENYEYSGQYNIDAFTLLAPDVTLAPDVALAPGTSILSEVLYD